MHLLFFLSFQLVRCTLDAILSLLNQTQPYPHNTNLDSLPHVDSSFHCSRYVYPSGHEMFCITEKSEQVVWGEKMQVSSTQYCRKHTTCRIQPEWSVDATWHSTSSFTSSLAKWLQITHSKYPYSSDDTRPAFTSLTQTLTSTTPGPCRVYFIPLVYKITVNLTTFQKIHHHRSHIQKLITITIPLRYDRTYLLGKFVLN
ncbi:hypothetical protein DSO57_1018934 [Entomophthora muscae]|uniref:Uncharacterized protein n=1 Tax=Entomophthora muscae TaxID=34485 RepID=A0ACC2T461_9FUNG|nr:hypothetical protein DSO57_1018934 [Entomophthora muscae]